MPDFAKHLLICAASRHRPSDAARQPKPITCRRELPRRGQIVKALSSGDAWLMKRACRSLIGERFK